MATPRLEAKAEVVEAAAARAKLAQELAVGEASCNNPIVVDEAERLRVQELLR
jgi:hypothetical protein